MGKAFILFKVAKIEFFKQIISRGPNEQMMGVGPLKFFYLALFHKDISL